MIKVLFINKQFKLINKNKFLITKFPLAILNKNFKIFILYLLLLKALKITIDFFALF